ncbi:Tetratricopeptide repeat protein 28 [Exaiptasia diaphana]|nr:Tetratricopeptide repeat protein 28 [Exaiptasia diaphana]
MASSAQSDHYEPFQSATMNSAQFDHQVTNPNSGRKKAKMCTDVIDSEAALLEELQKMDQKGTLIDIRHVEGILQKAPLYKYSDTVKMKLYFHLGKAYYVSRDFDEAIQHFKEHRVIARRNSNKEEEQLACTNLGRCYDGLSKYQKAIEYHKISLKIAKGRADKYGERCAYTNLGGALDKLADFKKALENHERSLQIARDIGDRQGEGECYCNMSNVHLKMGNLQIAFKYAQHALDIAVEVGDKRGEGRARGSLGNASNILGNPTDAEEHLLRQLQIAEELHDPYSEMEAYRNLSSSYFTWDKHCLKRYNQKYLDIAKELQDKHAEAKAYAHEGRNCLSNGQFKEAIEHQKRALVAAKELGDRRFEGDVNRNLGICYQYVGKYQKAQSYFQECREITKTIEDKIAQADVLQRLGNIYLIQGREDKAIDKAIEYFESSLRIAELTGFKKQQARAYGGLGKCYERKKNYDVAVENHKKDLEISVQIKHAVGESKAREHIGRAYLFLKKYKEAQEYCEKSLQIALQRDDRLALKQPNRLSRRDFKKVLQWFTLLHMVMQKEGVLSPNIDQLEAGKVPDEKDYLLTINEVQEIGLRAKLVVLSCCYSGRGEIKSEGVVGMSRAFFAAGALAVVASLWAVDDLGTRVFMEKFYGHLKRGEKASVSLQQAMKEMRDIERYSKPNYWAPFFLIGEDVTIDVSEESSVN